jgi:prolipoprotein diacylglyceryltransferase
MGNLVFVSLIASLIAAIFYWGFRNLPAERWQMIASVPIKKGNNGDWQGLNLTYYGFFNATAIAFACLMVLILMGSVGAPLIATVGMLTVGLVIALPSARIVAGVIERKPHTFTVGGAVFVAILVLPWLINFFNAAAAGWLFIPPRPMLAAIAIGYTFGEAIGRLACISFGCCYGRSLTELPPSFRRVLGRFSFVFTGETKKASYEGKLNGTPVVPIQAITSIVFAVTGMIGLSLFLESRWSAALMVPLAGTQIWRVLSEFLRADFRGGTKISAYQVMAVLCLLYGLLILPFLGNPTLPTPNLARALLIIGNVWSLLLIQILWLSVFLYLGRSFVTASRVSFWVITDRI